MPALLTVLCEQLRNNAPVAVVTIATREGSAPRTAGAKMLVTAEGLLAGTIGGGLLEARALDAGRHIAVHGGSRLLRIDLEGAPDQGADMICGGNLLVFIEQAHPRDLAFFSECLERLERGESVHVLTCLGSGGSGERRLRAAQPGDAGGARLELAGDVEWLCEPYRRQSLLVIAGGGHVSLPTAQIGASCGFSVAILDDRPEFAFPARFPWAQRVLHKPGFENCFAGLPIQTDSALVIVTRGHAFDGVVLEQALRTDAGYVGMIGSSRKRDVLYDKLKAKGVSEAAIARVRSPIGLPIGAETPAEIAVSILAEIISVRAPRKPGT